MLISIPLNINACTSLRSVLGLMLVIHLNSDVIQSLMFASKRILLLPVAFLVNTTESNQM